MNRLRTFSNSWSSWRSFSESSAVEEIVNDSLLDDNDDDDELWGVEEELKEGEGGEGGLALEIWRSGAWRVYPVLFFLMLSYSIILPLLPQLCTNEFASSSAGKALKCEDFVAEEAPLSCKDAHGACVSYQAAWQFVNNSIICAAVIPLLGAASDRKGRKPILIISTLLAGSPPFLLLFSGKFKVLYPVISLATGLGPLGTCLAITSDLIQKKNRSQAMSIVLGNIFLSITIGPLFVHFLTARGITLAACTLSASSLLLACSTVPESLQTHDSKRAVKVKGILKRSWSIKALFRARTFVLIASISFIGSMTSEGSQEVSAQFLQIVNGFSIADQANLLVAIGLVGLFTQFLLTPMLLSRVGPKSEKFVIVIVNFFLVFVNLAIAFFSKNKLLASTLISAGFAGMISFTVATGILSKAVSVRHQGLVTGVISGIRQQAYGIGSVLYALIFGACADYFPGAPFVFSAILMVFSGLLAFFLDNQSIDIDDL